MKDVFEVQSDIAQQIVRKFQLNLSNADKKRLATAPTLSTEAYDLYLKASSLISPRLGIGGELLNRQKAIELLKEAIRIDAEFSDAYALLSENYTFIGISAANPKNWLDSASILAKKATQISPDRESGYMALAYVNQWKGLHDEQLKWLLKAHEIKPFSTILDIVENYTRKNDYEKAYRWVLKAEEFDPSEPGNYASKGFIYSNLGMLDSLKNTIDRARRIKNASADIDVLALIYYTFTRKQDEYIETVAK